MTSGDPRRALMEYLVTPRIRHINGIEVNDPLTAADPASIRFGRALAASGRRLHVVDYTDLHGQTWHFVFFLREDENGQWHVAGGGGGGNGALSRPRPSVNLAAGWGGFGMWAGGRVLDNGADVTRVRLGGPDGLVLEDMVAEGHALFITEQPVLDPSPIRAELFDVAGLLVESHNAFFS